MSSVRINANEVLTHLNQLGYQNISPQQLKDFMRDLKKLIKHEERCQERIHATKENVAPVKKRVTNESVVSIQIRDCAKQETSTPKASKTKSQTVGSEKAGSSKSSATKSRPVSSKKSHKTKFRTLSESETTATTLSESTNTDNVMAIKQDVACSTERKKATRVKFCGDFEITQPSYIICRNPVKTIKSDPVALYHKYEEEWKKFKLPGEDMHKNLRWAIRERMCGQTPRTMSAAPSMEVIATKRKSCRI